MKSILDILKSELIGKTLRITKTTPVKETYTEEVKKSKNVTDKQFESGDPKYRMTATRTRIVRHDTEIKESKIVDIDLLGTWGSEVDIRIDTKDG